MSLCHLKIANQQLLNVLSFEFYTILSTLIAYHVPVRIVQHLGSTSVQLHEKSFDHFYQYCSHPLRCQLKIPRNQNQRCHHCCSSSPMMPNNELMLGYGPFVLHGYFRIYYPPEHFQEQHALLHLIALFLIEKKTN